MMDTLTAEQRNRSMARVKNKDTAPEMIIRCGLHALGFRFRLHAKKLAGKPDIVLPKYQTAIFVHGCFWHRHDCPRASIPQSHMDFWLDKFEKNVTRDKANISCLKKAGWKVLIIWECALRGPNKLAKDILFATIVNFLRLDQKSYEEISGLNGSIYKV